MANLFTGLLACMVFIKAGAQNTIVLEHYNYFQEKQQTVFVPMLHWETKNNWYAELRYNYEEMNTVSFFAGKKFTTSKQLTLAVTPLAGISTGDFNGYSGAVNTDVEWKSLFLCMQSQYSRSFQDKEQNFFFNWSEAGVNIGNHLFAGGAFQFTKTNGGEIFEPGFLAGLQFGNVAIPLYVLNPFKVSRFFIVGLNIEYNLKNKKSKIQL